MPAQGAWGNASAAILAKTASEKEAAVESTEQEADSKEQAADSKEREAAQHLTTQAQLEGVKEEAAEPL